MSSFNIEDYIIDVSQRALTQSGILYCSDIVNITKDDGIQEIKAENLFYSINDEGVKTKLGSLTFTDSGAGIYVGDNTEATMSFTENGIELAGGTVNFEASSVEIEDIDIILASNAEEESDINGGGVLLGTTASGQKQFIYSVPDDFWTTNTGINVQTGHAFTVNTDTVVLDEAGLTIDDITLSQTGLSIGSEVSVTSSSITLGSTDPVVLNSLGLAVGSSLSLDTTNGLIAGDITLNNASGLVIGTGSNQVVLDDAGLNVGTDLRLNTSGLFVGDTEFSVANGIVFDDVTLRNTGLTFEHETTGNVILNNEGLYLGDDISVTKASGITVAAMSFGTPPNETLVNDTGLYIKNNASAIYMGDSQQWKIVYDETTENLKFMFYDTTSSSYVVKAEMQST